MLRALVLLVTLILANGRLHSQSKSIEQLVLNYFVDSVFEDNLTGYAKIRFAGKTEKEYSEPSLDFTTCLPNRREFKELYLEAIKLDSIELVSVYKVPVDVQKANKIIGKSKRYYLMKLFKGTKLDNSTYVKIELVKKNHLIEFYFELRNEIMYDWCKQSILTD